MLSAYSKEATMRCEAPECMAVATGHHKFLDPRRSHDVIAEYTTKYFCSPLCEQLIVDELERQSWIAHVVPDAKPS